jgi:hypothetical protein
MRVIIGLWYPGEDPGEGLFLFAQIISDRLMMLFLVSLLGDSTHPLIHSLRRNLRSYQDAAQCAAMHLLCTEDSHAL